MASLIIHLIRFKFWESSESSKWKKNSSVELRSRTILMRFWSLILNFDAVSTGSLFQNFKLKLKLTCFFLITSSMNTPKEKNIPKYLGTVGTYLFCWSVALLFYMVVLFIFSDQIYTTGTQPDPEPKARMRFRPVLAAPVPPSQTLVR